MKFLDWARLTSSSSVDDNSRAIAVDSADNIIITGRFSGNTDFNPGAGAFGLLSRGSSDVFVVKLSSAGVFQWAGQMGGIDYDIGHAIAVDSADNIIVTGRFAGTADFNPGAGTFELTSNGQHDVFVVKLSSAGVFQWALKLGGDGLDAGYGVEADSADNIIVTGRFKGRVDFNPGPGTFELTSIPSLDWDVFVVKISAAGDFRWAVNTGSINGDYGDSIRVDSADNVIVTGWFSLTSDFDPGAGSLLLSATAERDVFLWKLNPDGLLLSAFKMGGSGKDEGIDLALDSDGNIIVTGRFQNTVDFNPGAGSFPLSAAGGYDAFAVKLNSAGGFLWAFKIGGTGDDCGAAIAVDSADNIIITGWFSGEVDFNPGADTFKLTSQGVSDAFVVKLSSAGVFQSAIKIGGTGTGAALDYGRAIAVDSADGIIFTGDIVGTADFNPGAGSFELTAVGRDMFVAKLLETMPSDAPTGAPSEFPTTLPSSSPSFTPTIGDPAVIDCGLLKRSGNGVGGLCGDCKQGFVAASAVAGNSVCQLNCSAFPPYVCSGLHREACGSDPSHEQAGCGACLFGFRSESQDRASSCMPDCLEELCGLLAFRDICGDQPFQCGSCQAGFVEVARQQRCFNASCDVSSYETTECPLSAYCQVSPELCGGGSGDDCARRNRLANRGPGAGCLGCLPGYLPSTDDANAQNGTCLPDCGVLAQFDICPKLHRAACDPQDAVSQQPNACGACQPSERWQAPPSGSPLEACVANCEAHPPARCAALRRQPCNAFSPVRPGCGDPLPGHAFRSPADPAAFFHSYGAAIESGLSENALVGLQAQVLCLAATPAQCDSLNRGPCGKTGSNECGSCKEGFEFPQDSNQLALDPCSPMKEALLSNTHIVVIGVFASLAVIFAVLLGWFRRREKSNQVAKGNSKPFFMLLLFLLGFTLNLLFVYASNLQDTPEIFALGAVAIVFRTAVSVLISVQALATEMKASEKFKAWLSKHKAFILPMLGLGAIHTDNLLLFSSKLGSFDALSAPLREVSAGLFEAKGLYAVLAGDLPLWFLNVAFAAVRHEEGVPAFVFFSIGVGFLLLCLNIGKRWLARVAHTQTEKSIQMSTTPATTTDANDGKLTPTQTIDDSNSANSESSNIDTNIDSTNGESDNIDTSSDLVPANV